MFGKKILSMVLLMGMLISQSIPRASAASNCDHAQFVSDLTVPDGSAFAPGAALTKTWRLMNIGTCTWTTAYSLVWAGGDALGAPAAVKLPADVPPGQMVDISVNLTAPAANGPYRALFKIANPSGVQFGIGDSASDPFWTAINVVETSAMVYDFVANAPYAQWKSGAGLLPYPGTSGDSRGFAYQVNTPHLEDDSVDPSPGLLAVPQNKFNGYIQATYPEFQVQQGDRLQTLVNCEFGATGCYATFRIDYLLPNGVQRTLWSWKEAYDKRFYRANLDLSSLAGQKVRFVFMLLSTGFASGDRAIWGSPRIVRAGSTQPPAPPATLTPLPPLPPTSTPIGQPPPTIQPSGCDKAAFVTDVTVPDGTIFAPGAGFTKTWRLKNAGTCPWTTSYKLVYYSGDQMSAPTAVNLPWSVAVGQTVDISVNMIAPLTAAKYRGYWILANTNGQLFGIGAGASNALWAEINVAGEAPANTGYDFTSNVCSAEWRSTVGVLPCPGTDGNANGFVIKLDAPKMEDGTTGTPGLLTVPQNRYNGYIQGFYPTFTVQPGDKFQAAVGCEYGAACSLTYRLDYMTATGYIGTFWSWREQNDGKVYNATVDLTPLAGRSVRFILTILATGTPANDRALWGSPRIVRSGGTTPTITPVPPTDNWPLHTNSTYGLQFKYPPQSERFFETNNSILIKMPIAPGTNLREKYLQLTVRENISPCQSPLAESGTPRPPENVVINGITFLKQAAADAGVGHLHDWVGYSTLKNNACISMEFVLHSLNAGNYATPVPEFDKAAESAAFTQVMSTFGWTAPTVTPIPSTVPPVVVPSPLIQKLFMMDASNGWALGNAYVLRTSNGGATWYNVSMPSGSSVRSGFFQSASKGWVLTTDSIYRTLDGGATWSRYNVPFNGGYIQFLDDTRGFVLSGEPSGMQKHAVYLYQTLDGGATWTLKYANDPSQPNNSLPFGGHKLGMTFRDASTGWVGGDYPSPGFVYLYKTTDSGATWSQQSLALPPGYESAQLTIQAPKFFGSNDAILPVWMTRLGGRDLFIYVSHDGGATWTRSSGVVGQGINTDFISVNDGVAWSLNGTFQVTHTSGQSWTSLTPNVNFVDNMPYIDFVSTTTGWVMQNAFNGATPLYRTTDGGATWTLVSGTAPPTTPVVPQFMPDLTIAGMSIELQSPSCLRPGDPLGVRVWVKNNGQAAVGSFVVRVNGIEQTASGLGIGETTALFFANASNPVSAVVDPAGAVAESDENNNSRSEMLPVPTPPLPCATPTFTPTTTPAASPTELVQSIVNGLNTRNFESLRAAMDQSFIFGYWQSQGTADTADVAIENLRTGNLSAITPLVPDPSKNLVTLLGGLDPYSIMGLDPAKSQALFISGWGLDGQSEAILYLTRRTDGSLYWYGVLIAKGGFAAGSDVVSREAFCADKRIAPLIEQLKQAMTQSNGALLASLVSPKHGLNLNYWPSSDTVYYTSATVQTVFTDPQVINWGSGGGSGKVDTGTFAEIVQPQLIDVLNSAYQLNCDTLSYGADYTDVARYANTNIHFYSVVKPPTMDLDWKVWLIRIEYVDGRPYLFGAVHYVWEP